LACSLFARSLADPLTTRVRDNARFQRFSDHLLNDSIKLLHRPVESTARCRLSGCCAANSWYLGWGEHSAQSPFLSAMNTSETRLLSVLAERKG
ncbi:TPA: hypothetical protein ACK3SN_005880, partial [Burkholderia cepacia]